jgi:hypothetical protein
MKLVAHEARIADMSNVYTILTCKPEGKRSLGSHRRTWEGNIKMDLNEIMCEDIDWINPAQHRVQTGSCEHVN